MPLRIFNNLNSSIAQNRLGTNNRDLGESISRVASGDRLTGSGASATDKSISELLNSDSRALRQAARNLNDGIGLINIAEGALNEQTGALIRIREILSAADGATPDLVRETLQIEINTLKDEFNRIASSTDFNGQNILDGSLAASVEGPEHVVILIGINSDESGRIDLNEVVNLGSTDSSSLGLDDLSVATFQEAIEGLASVDKALEDIISFRASIGATQNRFTRALSNLNISIENLNAASSVIKDADFAEEVTDLTRRQLLVQSSAAMVGQANLIPEGVLLLLQQ